MPAPTLFSEHPLAAETTPVQPEAPAATAADTPGPAPARFTLRTAWPLIAMATGLVVLALAATVVVRSARGGSRPAATVSAATAEPSAITVSARDVSVVSQVYGPGEQSGWHTHPGIHAVAVLSGVLSVYDDQCRLQTFEAGRPYVGGQQPHLVRNETDAPVVMAVTYLSPAAPGTSTQHSGTEHLPPPAGCSIG